MQRDSADAGEGRRQEGSVFPVVLGGCRNQSPDRKGEDAEAAPTGKMGNCRQQGGRSGDRARV